MNDETKRNQKVTNVKKLAFTKTQALGNDFIIINGARDDIHIGRELVVKLCRRRLGIGADGLIIIRSSDSADFFMQFFNPDGSEAEMCGNGIRCFAKYLYDRKLVNKNQITVETIAGEREVSLLFEEDEVVGARVSMGKPIFNPKEVPVLLEGNEIIDYELSIDGDKLKITCLSIGNPHVVVLVEEVVDDLVKTLGPKLESHSIFPNRTNVEFVKVLGKSEIEVRVWERGVGETLACGTGACSAVVAAQKVGKVEGNVKVKLLGGYAYVEWQNEEEVYLTGPVQEVYTGEVDTLKI